MRKNITSIIVFGINLFLVGIGFLFIKNNEEAKKNQASGKADADFYETSDSENGSMVNGSVQTDLSVTAPMQKNDPADTTIKNNSTPKDVTVNPAPQNTISTPNPSSQKSSAKTKTS